MHCIVKTVSCDLCSRCGRAFTPYSKSSMCFFVVRKPERHPFIRDAQFQIYFQYVIIIKQLMKFVLKSDCFQWSRFSWSYREKTKQQSYLNKENLDYQDMKFRRKLTFPRTILFMYHGTISKNANWVFVTLDWSLKCAFVLCYAIIRLPTNLGSPSNSQWLNHAIGSKKNLVFYKHNITGKVIIFMVKITLVLMPFQGPRR